MVISASHPSRLHIQSINPSRSTESIQRSNSIWTTHSNQSTKPWPFDAITSLSTPLNLTAAPRANKSPSTVKPRKTAITSQFACAAAMYRKGINNISGYTEGKRGETRASVFLHRICFPPPHLHPHRISIPIAITTSLQFSSANSIRSTSKHTHIRAAHSRPISCFLRFFQ